VYEFVPGNITEKLFPGALPSENEQYTADSILNDPQVKIVTFDTISHVAGIPDGRVDSLGFKNNPGDTLAIDSIAIPVEKNPLQSFLDTLSSSKGQVRIIYYGDSQIEGDRITSFLRHSLRLKTGGTGPGLFLPVMPVMYTKTTALRSSSNWKRYNYLSYTKDEISHRKFGPFMAICRYLPEGETADEPVKAFVRVMPSNTADSASSYYDRLRIFYRNAEGPVSIIIRAGEVVVLDDSLRTGNKLNELSCLLNNRGEISIEFSGKVSPDIYGISIESSKGLVLDNIPQRGSAGLEFTMVDKKNLSESYRILAPDLFILHYGLNVVRNVKQDYSYYMKGLVRQLALLKEVSPQTPILVIGLTDMAQRQGDSISSYRNIPSIIEAQKEATKEEHVSFWDSYHAMGGKASIIRWAEKDPPLAQQDLVHLTYPGADTLSKMLYDSVFTCWTSSVEDTGKPLRTELVTSQDQLIQKLPDNTPENQSFLKVLSGWVFGYDISRPLIFSTPAFWLFLLIVLAGYSFVYKKTFLRNFYLLLVSLFFYYKSGGVFLFLLIMVIVIDYTVGLLLHSSEKKAARRLLLLVSLISNLGILAYFKYTGFIVQTINDLLGTDYRVYDYLASFSNASLGTAFNINNILLPVGISFFTFQSLSYTIDVYRKRMEPVRSIIDFGFYVSFFPQLVAGPIVRASEFIPQLYEKYHLDEREFNHALFLILKGLIKKIIISDFLAVNFIDRVFDMPSMYSGFENLMAVYGYGLQIYCDFSGYTDIAIGLGLIFGFRLPLNFNSPYKASDVSDFWKRWHISLSRWLKDYLYIPLGGNRKGKFREYINLIITMLLGGLWHGADLRFIIWGLLHGVGLVFDRLWKLLTGGKSRGKLGRVLSIFVTFQFVNFCWIFFRAPDLGNVRIMLEQIFLNFSPGSYYEVIVAYSSVILLMSAGYLVHFLPENLKESYRGIFIRVPLPVQFAIIMVIAVLLFSLSATETMPFIYFRF
jgi:D-alanyl-lipoteichoic acid acyltransferase DltB (MBOAT superfamily)